VDDDERFATSVTRALRRRGHHAQAAHSADLALDRIQGDGFDIVLLDLHMPNRDGFEVLRELRRYPGGPVVFVLTGDDSLESAVKAMRLGALDFLTKPIALEDLVSSLDRAMATATVRSRMRRRALVEDDGPVAVSESMRQILRLADRVAGSPTASAMILGESGVGKEVVASYIHRRSDRADRPFVRVNVAALPSSMIEAELFGSTKGAFTGSQSDRTGLIASAEGGTLLLDELCELDINLQPKLLRVLETLSFFPVGSDKARTVDVRFLAATNVEPQVAIDQGKLRRDLFYRLGTLLLRIPPLRHRREDILPMAERFLQEGCSVVGRESVPTLTAATKSAMLEHPWPGNARQLRNAMHRATMLLDASEDTITLEHLGLEHRSRPAIPTPAPEEPQGEAADAEIDDLSVVKARAVEAAERRQIERALRVAGGSPTEAAKLLNVSRTTLWSKIKRYGLDS